MKRLDQFLVELGLAPSRTKAQDLIQHGDVEIVVRGQWQIAKDNHTPADQLTSDQIRIQPEAQILKFVSRGGLKLESAFRNLNLSAQGWRCLDIGQSTGGFTDFLIQAGARAVLGFDVGHGQLHPKIKADPRVESFEGLHFRDMTSDPRVSEWLKVGLDLCVVDVSFVSIRHLWPELKAILPAGSRILVLVKPQFEVGPKTLTEEMYADVQRRVLPEAEKYGFSVDRYFPSEVKGQDGTQEYFLFGTRRDSAADTRVRE